MRFARGTRASPGQVGFTCPLYHLYQENEGQIHARGDPEQAGDQVVDRVGSPSRCAPIQALERSWYTWYIDEIRPLNRQDGVPRRQFQVVHGASSRPCGEDVCPGQDRFPGVYHVRWYTSRPERPPLFVGDLSPRRPPSCTVQLPRALRSRRSRAGRDRRAVAARYPSASMRHPGEHTGIQASV